MVSEKRSYGNGSGAAEFVEKNKSEVDRKEHIEPLDSFVTFAFFVV